MGSLLAVLNNVWGVLVELQFVVQCDPEVSETVHNLHWLIVNVFNICLCPRQFPFFATQKLIIHQVHDIKL